LFLLHNLTSSSSDNGGGGFSPLGIIAIAVAVPVGSTVFVLLLLLCVLIILLIIILLIIVCCVFLLAPKKFDENFSVKSTDVVDADLGKKTEVSMGDSNTRVEFPDLDAPS